MVVREVEKLAAALQNPESPMLLIVGGAKTDDSLKSIEHFLSNGTANCVLTGGLVGLTFLLAAGFRPNEKTLENIKRGTQNLEVAIKKAKDLLDEHGRDKIEIPVDIAVGPPNGFERKTYKVKEFSPGNVRHQIGDIGVETIARYIGKIAEARTIVMNGTLGRYEWHCFEAGTREILRFVGRMSHDTGTHSLIGGGDTSAALDRLTVDLAENIDRCLSGKAFLEVLASGSVESLVGVRALAREPGA